MATSVGGDISSSPIELKIRLGAVHDLLGVAETAIRHHESHIGAGETWTPQTFRRRTTTLPSIGEGWSSQPDLGEKWDVEKAHARDPELFRRMSR